MQTDYAPECLHTDVPSKEALLAAAQDGSILQATAARCDVQHNLILPLDGMTGIMPREECALGIDTGTTREIAILSRVGKPVSFQVLCIRGDVAYVSRRRAQQRAFEQLLHKRPGDILPVRVTHLEPFGAFVDAGCGLVSLIGIENLSVSRIFHPSDRVQVGQQLYAVLSGIDADTGRISLTHRELLGTWAENAAQFAAGETVCGIVRSVEDYGVFIELAPNLSGLAEPALSGCRRRFGLLLHQVHFAGAHENQAQPHRPHRNRAGAAAPAAVFYHKRAHLALAVLAAVLCGAAHLHGI